MARDTNFTKAVKELLGNDPSGTAPSAPASVDDSSGHVTDSGTPASFAGYPGERDYDNYGAPPQPPLPPVSPPSSYQDWGPAAMPPDVTYITKDTIVTGSISSKSHVHMEGQMTGDITSEKDVKITGKVDGNVDGDNIMLIDGAVIGDLAGKADVTVDSTAVVIGNVSADSFDADGRVKGSLKVGNSVALKSNAIIFGNITSKSLNVQDGAVIRGNVQVVSPRSDDEDLFSISRKSRFGELEG